MELEEERNNSDLLSERITRSREQVLFCRWVMCGSSCMEKEMWEVNPEDLTGGGGESPGLMEMMEDGTSRYKGGEINTIKCVAWMFPEWLWKTISSSQQASAFRAEALRIMSSASNCVKFGGYHCISAIGSKWYGAVCSFKNFASELAVHTFICMWGVHSTVTVPWKWLIFAVFNRQELHWYLILTGTLGGSQGQFALSSHCR